MIDTQRLFIGHYALRDTPIESRFAAAAAAGFDGISVSWAEASRSPDAPSLIGKRLKAEGLVASQLEIVRLPSGPDLKGFTEEARHAACVAAELDCPVVVAVCLDTEIGFKEVLNGFAVLSAECAHAGRRCAVEFVPMLSAIPDLAHAARLLSTVDNPAACIVIDSLHFFRAGEQWPELSRLRASDIGVIQISDAPLKPTTADYREEAMHLRELPGHGELDLCRLLAAVDETGVDIPLTVEVMSRELACRTATEATRRMAEATRALLHRYQHSGGRTP